MSKACGRGFDSPRLHQIPFQSSPPKARKSLKIKVSGFFTSGQQVSGLEQSRQDRGAFGQTSPAIRLGEVGSQIGAIQKEREELQSRLDALTRLEEFIAFEELDWASVAAEIASLEEERLQLELASDVLQQLSVRLRALQQALKETETTFQAALVKQGEVHSRTTAMEELH